MIRHRPPAADSESARELVAALARAGIDEVDASSRRRAEYSSDASLYRVPPLGVVFPRDASQVAAIVDICRLQGVPITARGSGTSIAGNAIGPGLVVEMRKHLDKIKAVDLEAQTATVDPGVVLDDLQRAARPLGLRFGPDPSTHNRCTLGGMIGNNACGSRALGLGRTADNVERLTLVTGRGESIHAGTGLQGLVGEHLRRLVTTHRAAIGTELDRFPRQISGYGLHHLLPEHGEHVARSLVGSEGTCGLVTEATLRLVKIPASTVLVVLGFANIAEAADAAPVAARGFDAIAVEGLDRRILDVARLAGGAVPDMPIGDAWLLVELAGSAEAELLSKVPELVRSTGAVAHRALRNDSEAAAVWTIRENGSGLVARGSVRPFHAGWEDAAVPVDRLGAYLREFEQLLQDHGLTGIPYGHFGDGCVHVRIDFPLRDSTRVFVEFLHDAAHLVVRHGGSLSGEHGDGRARSDLLSVMYSAEAIESFRIFKAAFDPDNILNPGIIVDPAPVDRDLRAQHAAPVRLRGRALALIDDGGDLTAAVHRCTGVGRCITAGITAGQVMCPSFAATNDEQHSTRGRARTLQEAAAGSFAKGLRSPEVHASLDWCLACRGCLTDCPTGVDMATYKAEVLHQKYRHRLRPRQHYSLGWLPRWLSLASRSPAITNWVTRRRSLAGAMSWLGGVDARRSMPLVHRPPRLVTREVADSPRALLWVDTFTRFVDGHIAEDAVQVLERAGYSVHVAGGELCCGLTWLSTGQLDGARRRLRRSVDALDAQLTSNTIVVGLEPSCTAVLKRDSLELLGASDPAAQRVAAATRTLAQALLAQGEKWQPPELNGVQLVAQPHCHHHAVLGWTADELVLNSTGAEVTRVPGCCGLAGDFGATRGRYEISKRVAATALLPALECSPAATVLADGFSCRTQIKDLTARDAIHLANLLAAPNLDHAARRALRTDPPLEPLSSPTYSYDDQHRAAGEGTPSASAATGVEKRWWASLRRPQRTDLKGREL